MDGVSAEDDTDTLFAALQKDAGGENVCALQYQWRGLSENESLLYLYYYPNENGSARVKLTVIFRRLCREERQPQESFRST